MTKQLAATFLAIAFSTSAWAQSTPILDAAPQGWQAETVADGLDYPWDIVTDGDRLIVTEKAGQIVIVTDDNLERFPVETSSPLRTDGGAGLMGIVLAPDFADSNRAFIYYAYEDGGPLNRVAEVSFDGSVWRETAVLIDAIPGHRLYNGGRIAIGPDRHLYVTTGWTENRERPQNLDNLAGKILRVALDGSIPADNPFADSPVWSYGHRNPQGLAWNAEGELFSAEHGQSALDEINLIRPGANYGWPLVSGDETGDGMEPPFVHSGNTTWAPSGIAFAGDELLITALRGEELLVMDREARNVTAMADTDERYRQVLPVGDDVYVITTNRSPRSSGPSEDRLLRLTPAQ